MSTVTSKYILSSSQSFIFSCNFTSEWKESRQKGKILIHLNKQTKIEVNSLTLKCERFLTCSGWIMYSAQEIQSLETMKNNLTNDNLINW